MTVPPLPPLCSASIHTDCCSNVGAAMMNFVRLVLPSRSPKDEARSGSALSFVSTGASSLMQNFWPAREDLGLATLKTSGTRWATASGRLALSFAKIKRKRSAGGMEGKTTFGKTTQCLALKPVGVSCLIAPA